MDILFENIESEEEGGGIIILIIRERPFFIFKFYR